MTRDVHCPKCGEFQVHGHGAVTTCPRCGCDQVIVLMHRDDIDDRFKREREDARLRQML